MSPFSSLALTRFFALLPGLLAGLLLATGSAHAAVVKTDHLESELISRTRALVPGEKALLGLRMKHEAHWHTYWQNPGDSGMPTTLTWRLPPGFKASPILWPVPKRIPIPPLMNHGYEGEMVLPVEITVPRDWVPGTDARIALKADWLICKEVCIPGTGEYELTLPVVAGNPVPEQKFAALFDAALKAQPQPYKGDVTASTADARIVLAFAQAAATPASVSVLSMIEGLVEHAAPQNVRVEGGKTIITIEVAKNLNAVEPRFAGVVSGLGAPGEPAFSFSTSMPGKLVEGKGVPVAVRAATAGQAGATPETQQLSLWLALGFAFIGGLILNLMPCVFPVLSIKILGFAQSGGEARGMRAHGLAFAAGVVLSFIVLALMLIGFKQAGSAVGWGFQLQSPLVITGLILLFFALGLNLSGVFNFGSVVPSSVASVTIKNPLVDAFFSGVLAALVASPCTAPFMGAALGYAMTQPTAYALAVFAALGIGMALPYVLLSFYPAWLKRLPRPGPWLDTFKQFLAFPMYATVVWLTWVLLLQTGVNTVVGLGAALVLLALGGWLLGRAQGAPGRAIALVAFAAALFIAWPTEGDAIKTPASTASSEGWQAWSQEEVAKLTAAGTPVFVDFTAAWCVTCQVNKRTVLETTAVRQAFAAKGVTLLRADWTRADPKITQALASFGRNGVPVYVFYAPGKAPVLLPEVLREQHVMDALKTL